MTLDFKIELKDKSNAALAFIVAYSKAFRHYRFIWSTGIKVKAKGFNPVRPGQALKRLLKVADTAVESLTASGHPINQETLKARIELIRDRIRFEGNELHIWTGSGVQFFPLSESISREALERDLQKELAKQAPDFKTVIQTHLTEGRNGLFGFWQAVLDGKVRAKAGKELRKNTLKGKRQTLMLLKEFDPAASFEKMDMAFYNAFSAWMANQKVTVQGPDGVLTTRPRFDSNSMGKHIKEIKAILHLAYRNEIMNHDRFRYWPVTKEKNEVVTFSKDELLKLHQLEKTGTKGDVKDLFVMACFLGPRISDYKSFEKDNLSIVAGVMWFEYVQEKTGERVKIPVHPIVQEILNKRNGEFPRMISEQNFRAYLKEICKDAGMTDRVITKIRNSKPEYKPKWQAISPHSARRTFATSLYYGWFNKPMPASFCMRYTGHKSEKSFMAYIGATEQEKDAKALEYFDLKPVMKVS